METGTKYGGSAIFFASMLNLLEQKQGGVITIDINLNEDAKNNFKTHPQGKLVREYMIGNAGDEILVSRVRSMIESVPGPVMVFLDDNHEADHVYSELQLYTPLVTVGSYCIVADTLFEDLAGTPILDPNSESKEYVNANPRIALRHFLAQQKNFTPDNTFSGGGA
ncbi:MAG TPA: CmcI family methyltransferase, partial [Opitutales bacterium]|nr:CmcI family methyltransferase [Opitutales bacterium]